MQIISHRGFWQNGSEKNSLIAFKRSFDLGFGTETDLRDRNGRIAIAHDVLDVGDLFLEDLLKIMDGRNLPLALNIKADGLSEYIKQILNDYGHDNYFTFDMSIPDMLSQIKKGLKVFTGFSDLIKEPILISEAEGVWLDSFYKDWFDADTVDGILQSGRYVCVVSPELHNRSIEVQWSILKNVERFDSNKLILCTDHPLKAQEYFGV